MIVLVHGFLGTSATMRPLARALRARGWATTSFTRNSLVSLDAQAKVLERHAHATSFVTHSLGALVLRRLLATRRLDGRVVMLAPPNAGSRLARHVSERFFRGPLAAVDPLRALHAGDTGEPRGPLPEIGIIAGVSSGAWPLARATSEREHDGKVFLDETRLAGAKDFVTMPFEHGELLRRPEVADEIAHFLGTARFSEGARQRSFARPAESRSGSHQSARDNRR